MLIETSKIIPTHNSFRNPEKAKEMMAVKDYADYILSNQRSPIVLIKTEDGQLWCHDGHHRLAAIDYHYGQIDEEYVEIKEYTYFQLNSINLDCGYVTPYDPRTECRLPNFWEVKQKWIRFFEVTRMQNMLEAYIYNFGDSYKESRKVHTLRELCNTLSS